MKTLMNLFIPMLLIGIFSSCSKENCDAIETFIEEGVRVKNDKAPYYSFIDYYYFGSGDKLTFIHNAFKNDDIKVEWNFGDGSFGEGIPVDHVYEEAGEYTVTMVLSAGGVGTACESSKTIVLSIE